MKKLWCVLLCFTLSLGVVPVLAYGNNFYDEAAEEIRIIDNTTEFQEVSGSTIDYLSEIESLSDLENESDCILKVEILEGSKTIIRGLYNWGSSVTPARVVEVYYSGNNLSNDNLLLKENDEILIGEPYSIEPSIGDNFMKYMCNGYDSSKVGKEYIFFLGYSPDGSEEYGAPTFGVIRDIFGRYRVDVGEDLKQNKGKNITCFTPKDFSLEEAIGNGRLARYQLFFNEVMKKYMS